MAKILRDEKEWLDKSTRPIGKVIPVINKSLLLRILIFLVAFVIIFIKFHELFITLIAISIISYIRFKRTKFQIDIELEPSYLIAIALTLAFGVNYGILFVVIPMFVTILHGVSVGLIVNILNKIIVIYATYFYWITFNNETYMILVATALVLITDIIGFFIRRKFGQPLPQIIQVMATNTIIRYIYFSLFLDLIVKLIK
jgi:hypothetical protein